MAKKDLHPEWYNTKYVCDGKQILEIESTIKGVVIIDIWAGNHPFYTGSQKIIDTEGRVKKFEKKYNII